MKKILAIAVATAISAPAMADMTIGGSIDYRYRSVDATKDVAAVEAVTAAKNGGIAIEEVAATESTSKDAGFGIDNAQLNIKASETLDNGLTVAAAFDVDNLYRDATASGNNATLSISGDFGTVMMGAVEVGNGIVGLGGAGAPAEVLDGTVIAGGSNVDIVKYTTPAFGAFKVSASHTEGLGLGKGMSSAAMTVGVDASFGALTVKADTTRPSSDAYTRYRVAGSFDAGTVVVGAGYESQNVKAGDDVVQTIVGVAVPMGDLTLGATMMASDSEGEGSDASGYSVGGSYSLGGGVSTSVKYASWKDESDNNNESQNQVTASVSYKF